MNAFKFVNTVRTSGATDSVNGILSIALAFAVTKVPGSEDPAQFYKTHIEEMVEDVVCDINELQVVDVALVIKNTRQSYMHRCVGIYTPQHSTDPVLDTISDAGKAIIDRCIKALSV